MFIVHTVPRMILLWIEVDRITKFHFCLVSIEQKSTEKEFIPIPDRELEVQSQRSDEHIFLRRQPQHPYKQVSQTVLEFSKPVLDNFFQISSLNFFIYCFACKGFRTSLKDIIRTSSSWRRPALLSQTSELIDV